MKAKIEQLKKENDNIQKEYNENVKQIQTLNQRQDALTREIIGNERAIQVLEELKKSDTMEKQDRISNEITEDTISVFKETRKLYMPREQVKVERLTDSSGNLNKKGQRRVMEMLFE